MCAQSGPRYHSGMGWPLLVKRSALTVSAVLAALAAQPGLIPHPYHDIILWLSGALAGLPAYVDKFFGYVSVPKTSVYPPPQE